MTYEVTYETVNILEKMNQNLVDTLEQIKKDNACMWKLFDENKDGLVLEHIKSIKSILDEITNAIKQSNESAEGVSECILDLATAYRDIIENNPYSGDDSGVNKKELKKQHERNSKRSR